MAGLIRHVCTWSLLAVALLPAPDVAHAETLRYRLTDSLQLLEWGNLDGEPVASLPDGDWLREPGRPELPVRRLEFVVPADQRVASVQLTAGREVVLEPARRVRTSGAWITGSGEIARAVPERIEPGAWPLERAVLIGDRIVHGQRIISVEVRLLSSDAEGRLSFVDEAEITIDLEPDPRAATIVRRERVMPEWDARERQLLRDRLANPGDLPAQLFAATQGPPPSEVGVPGVAPSLDSSPVRHLTITTEEMRPEFERLAAWRTSTGLPAHVVTIEEVTANARQGVDLAETIREYVRDAYSWWGVDYLLIGADTEIIPTRFVRSTFYPGGSYTDIPTDQYFVCLDGDWNADGDALFGEHFKNAVDQGDYTDLGAELTVGRAPVRTLADATVFVDKVLQYERPVDTTYQQNLLMASEVLFPSDWTSPADNITLDGAALSETLDDTVFTPCAAPEVTLERLYQNHTAYPGSNPETVSSVNAALNSGDYGLFHHIGHGFYFNMSVGDGQLDVSHADGLQNGPNWFLLYSLNCSSSAFDFNCLNERFLTNPDGGSVVSIGSSRAAFPTAASEVQREFYKAWYCAGDVRVGDAHLASRASTVDNTFYNTIERWTQFVYCLLGDPATLLWDQAPGSATLFNATAMTLGQEQLALTVIADDGPPLPLAGVTVTARKGLEAYATGVTDGGGSVTLDFVPESAGQIEVWISGGGVEPKLTTINVNSVAAPIVSVVNTTLADNGSAGSSGNGNGSAEAGEVVALTPQLRNGGTTAFAGGGTAILRSQDPLVSVLDSVVTLPAIGAAGQALAGDSWTVSVDHSAPDGHSTALEVALAPSGAAARTDYIAFGLSAPEVGIIELVIDDSAGNGNGICDVGEEVDLVFSLRNYGMGAAEGLAGTMTVASGLGAVLDGAATWPNLPDPLDSSDNAANVFRVRVDEAAANVLFEFSLTDAAGRSHTRQFDLVAPAPAENLIVVSGQPASLRLGWDPSPVADLMGYLVLSKGPGDPDFVLESPDILLAGSTYESTNLVPLSNYEFAVVTVDSAGLHSEPSIPLETSTYPAEIACFPVRMGLETSGALAVGMVDHDFDPELVVGADLVYVIDGNCTEKVDGDGDSQTLGPINNLSGQYQPGGIALGDLFEDHIGMEIVAHDRDSRKVYVFDDQGNVMPGWPQTLIGWAWATPVVGDLDNDGDLEIVMNDISGYAYAFHHDGTEVADGDSNPATHGVIAPRRQQDVGGTIYTESFGRGTPALFDVDGDGNRELLFGTKFQNESANEFFYALKADGSGTNAPGWPKVMPPRSEFLASATIADLGNDGIFDIIIPCENDSLYIWDELGNLRPGFPLHRVQDSIRLGALTPSPAVADFDEDGDLEILFVSVVRLGSNNWVSRLEIIEDDGTTWPGWPVEAPDLSEGSPVVGDLDGDGSLDIAYGIGGVQADDGIYAFNLSGELLSGFPIPIDGFVRATPTIADLNRDGNVNLISASWDSQIHVWDLLAPYSEDLVPWPTFRGNVNRTGVYQEEVDTAAPGGPVAALRTSLGPARPNPFNPRTELSFVLESPTSDLLLVLYDAAGRRVRTLAVGDFDPGPHKAHWDGTDEQGRPVASGVYYARLSIDGADAGSRKLALVK